MAIQAMPRSTGAIWRVAGLPGSVALIDAV
jgi:hypothetical protein